MDQKTIHQCKHPKENKLFGFGVFISISLLILLFIGTFYRTEIVDWATTETVNSYKASHPADKNLNQQEVLAKMSDDDKEMLEMLDYYYWYIIALTPFAFFC